jgi:hypothetical protein
MRRLLSAACLWPEPKPNEKKLSRKGAKHARVSKLNSLSLNQLRTAIDRKIDDRKMTGTTDFDGGTAAFFCPDFRVTAKACRLACNIME